MISDICKLWLNLSIQMINSAITCRCRKSFLKITLNSSISMFLQKLLSRKSQKTRWIFTVYYGIIIEKTVALSTIKKLN